MTSLLTEQNCVDFDAIAGDKEHPLRLKETANARFMICITVNCSPVIVSTLVCLGNNAAVIWDHLYQKYSGVNLVRKYQGIRKLATFKYMTGTPENNVNRIDNILLETRTASGGDNISLNELAKTMFLDSLPSRFAAIRTMIETASKDYSINEIQNLLVAEESRQGSILADPLFAGSTTTPRNACKHGRSPAQCWTCDPTKHPSKAICSTCGEKGHKTSNSPKCTKTIIGASLKRANAICDNDGSWEEALPKPKFAKIAHVGAIQKRKEIETFSRDEEL